METDILVWYIQNRNYDQNESFNDKYGIYKLYMKSNTSNTDN